MSLSFETYLQSIEDVSIAQLREMVAINSFTHNRDGVCEVGEMCVSLFEPLGFSARRIRSVTEDCGDHLVLTREGSGDASLLLVSHLDTVYPENFPWREEGDLLYGPGVVDIKGGTILIWMILRALREHAPDLFERTGFTILLNASEEGGCADFPDIARRSVTPGCRACLVYEAGMEATAGTTIVIARKGAARFVLEAHGHEAHSGNQHESGASAILELAEKVLQIESWTDYRNGVTYNVGTIGGGTMVNCVPGHAACLVDLRAYTPKEFDAGRRRVMDLAGPGRVRSRDGLHACRLEVTERPGYPPWPPNGASDRLARMLVECGDELGLRIVPTRRKGSSDGCHVCDLLPTVDGLGPVGRGTHVFGAECADRSSFVPRALLSIRFLERLL